jgi:hypothetical protein
MLQGTGKFSNTSTEASPANYLGSVEAPTLDSALELETEHSDVQEYLPVYRSPRHVNVLPANACFAK